MTKDKIFTNSIFVAIAALFCCALWGSATPFIKTGYELVLLKNDVPSTILFAGCRFFLAGIFTVIIYSIARKKLLLSKKNSIANVIKLSFFQTIIQYMFFYIGLANTSGVKGTVESGSSAFFALLVASLIFKQEKLTLKKITACVLGFGGIILLNFKGLDFKMNFFGDAFVLFSGISLAFSSVMVKSYSKTEDPVVLSGYQFVFGGAVMIIIGILFGGRITLQSAVGVGILIYLAFLSAAAYSIWGLLLKYNPVSKITIYNFTTPVLGVILSKIMLAEQSNVSAINLILTLVLVSGGIILLNYRKS